MVVARKYALHDATELCEQARESGKYALDDVTELREQARESVDLEAGSPGTTRPVREDGAGGARAPWRTRAMSSSVTAPTPGPSNANSQATESVTASRSSKR